MTAQRRASKDRSTQIGPGKLGRAKPGAGESVPGESGPVESGPVGSNVDQTSTSHLDELCLDISLVRGSFSLYAQLRVGPGEILGIIGPNGAGKSSLIGAIAGNHHLAFGEVSIGDRVISRTNASPGQHLHLPRAERDVAHLDQRARLFPHLNARENVAFGPRSRGIRREEAHEHADAWLARVGLEGRGDARTHELSGGQLQRVAIARALAAAPTAVLLDEPFAALDIESAVGIRALVLAELRRLSVPVILVTHDPVDLIMLADRVAVLEGGRVQQVGTVSEVLGAPATPFTAHFAGRVLVYGVASSEGTLLLENAPMPELRGAGALPPVGAPACATYSPQALRVAPVQARTATVARLEGDNYRWVDRIARITPTHSALTVTGETWPEYPADVPLTTAISDHLTEGMYVEFSLSCGDVRFATATTSATAPA